MALKLLVFLFVMAGFVCLPQEKLGISNSNYSSTNSIYLNPSSSVDSRTYMQLNIVGANVFAMTNIAYLPNFSVWQAKRDNAIQDPIVPDSHLRKYLFGNASADGLAFVISKENYGAGLFVRGRSMASVRRLPYQVVDILAQQNPDPKIPNNLSLNIKNAAFSNMSWVEYGGNFGVMIKKQKTDLITVGASLRYITGINIAYGNVSRLQGNINDSVMQLDNAKAKIRYNDPAWNSGRGWGLDLGITYKKMLSGVDSYFANSKKSNCGYIDYKYKLALSLRDLGYINFKKVTSKADLDASGRIYTHPTDSSYSSLIQANLNTALTHGPILATLPTNLSAQFDWNFENHLYVNVTVVKNLVPNAVTGVQNTNLLSICPRYEFKQFEIAAPLTFQRFLYPQLGFAFRVRTFVLGFDNVFPLLFKKKTYGLNLYFSLGISLFKNPACKTKVNHVDYCPPKLRIPKRERKEERKRRKKNLGA